MKPTIHHIPICPFCQRIEVLLELKGLRDEVDFAVVDITKPRAEHILKLTGGTTALPVMDLGDGRALKESLVLMSYIEDRYPERPVRREDAYERAIENLLVAMEGAVVSAGYTLVLNQDRARQAQLAEAYFTQMERLDVFLRTHARGDGPWLFDRFGWAEAVYTPFFQRFVFIDYYEGVSLPEEERFARVRAWRDACMAHPAAQQTSDEEVIKLYYDYAIGHGNGSLPEGRAASSFAFEPSWRERPMPPRDKYGRVATDDELGLARRT